MLVAFGHTSNNGGQRAAEHLAKHHGFRVVRFDDGIRREMGKGRIMYRPGTGEAEIYSGITLLGTVRDAELEEILRGRGEMQGMYRVYAMPGEPPLEMLQWWRWRFRNRMHTVANLVLAAGGRTVIPDLHSREEFDFIKAQGGKVYKIERWEGDAEAEYEGSAHPMETALRDAEFDGEFINDGTSGFINEIVKGLKINGVEDGWTAGAGPARGSGRGAGIAGTGAGHGGGRKKKTKITLLG